MESIKEKFTSKEKVRISLQRNYDHACTNPKFKNLVNKVGMSREEAMKYTSKLEKILFQLEKCRECKGLFECSSDYEGNVEYPTKIEDKFYFTYTPCKYTKAITDKKNKKKTETQIIANSRMKDIDITDKNRVKVIKWLKSFYDKYDISKNMKGLYLHGNFGCGKTFLISCLLNELKIKKSASIEIVYFPETLRTLKDDWDLFADKMFNYQNVDILLIDDIGAEKVTDWGRDEVLGTILQSRMNDKLPTFFTSNLNIKELEEHLSNNGKDIIKARRIIERIKQLSEDIEMISENKRK